MKTSSSVQNDFFLWLDEVLSKALPKNTAAFHFNLYEGSESVHVQLMGTDSFVGMTDYWPGNETFSTGEAVFEVPFENAGNEWSEWLDYLKRLVSAYIMTGNNSVVLRSSKGVGIGFVDGDMYVLWSEPKA
ncbi:hypothetical protein [Pseudomonas sp. B392_1p]|uniref:hypothetical protein n=1 Tax=Pseudomonas sp. B392_1p TaxID=3457507 RepID=UPI003FD54593